MDYLSVTCAVSLTPRGGFNVVLSSYSGERTNGPVYEAFNVGPSQLKETLWEVEGQVHDMLKAYRRAWTSPPVMI